MSATAAHRSRLVTALLAATVTTGLTAGVFGDWAHTIMRGLATTDDRTFVAVFRALDRAILNPLFLGTFTGALGSTALAAVLSRRADRALRPWVAAAFALYLVAVVVTMAVHEPLNGVVRAVGDPTAVADPAALRAGLDEARWVGWHLLRTVAATVAFACLAWALVLSGRSVGVGSPPRAAP